MKILLPISPVSINAAFHGRQSRMIVGTRNELKHFKKELAEVNAEGYKKTNNDWYNELCFLCKRHDFRITQYTTVIGYPKGILHTIVINGRGHILKITEPLMKTIFQDVKKWITKVEEAQK